MPDSSDVSVFVRVMVDGEIEEIEMEHFHYLPRIGETVEMNYWRGNQLTFTVQDITYLIYNSGHTMVQRVTLHGEAR